MRAGAARAATFTRAGDAIVAVGASGVMRWMDGRWLMLAAGSIDPARVRGLAWAGADVIAVGELSLAARIRATGGAAMWSATAPDITNLALHVDPDGGATIVGE